MREGEVYVPLILAQGVRRSAGLHERHPGDAAGARGGYGEAPPVAYRCRRRGDRGPRAVEQVGRGVDLGRVLIGAAVRAGRQNLPAGEEHRCRVVDARRGLCRHGGPRAGAGFVQFGAVHRGGVRSAGAATDLEYRAVGQQDAIGVCPCIRHRSRVMPGRLRLGEIDVDQPMGIVPEAAAMVGRLEPYAA